MFYESNTIKLAHDRINRLYSKYVMRNWFIFGFG